jgi:hypothetical protein
LLHNAVDEFEQSSGISLVEIRGIKPTLKRAPQRWPFPVDHRKPSSIAATVLIDDRLTKKSLKLEPEAQRGYP